MFKMRPFWREGEGGKLSHVPLDGVLVAVRLHELECDLDVLLEHVDQLVNEGVTSQLEEDGFLGQ